MKSNGVDPTNYIMIKQKLSELYDCDIVEWIKGDDRLLECNIVVVLTTEAIPMQKSKGGAKGYLIGRGLYDGLDHWNNKVIEGEINDNPEIIPAALIIDQISSLQPQPYSQEISCNPTKKIVIQDASSWKDGYGAVVIEDSAVYLSCFVPLRSNGDDNVVIPDYFNRRR